MPQGARGPGGRAFVAPPAATTTTARLIAKAQRATQAAAAAGTAGTAGMGDVGGAGVRRRDGARPRRAGGR